jgi:hypothetical protein
MQARCIWGLHTVPETPPPRRRQTSNQPTRPATLGSSLRAHVRFIIVYRGCGRRTEPDIAELVERYGADTPVPEWAARLLCSQCGSREVDFVITGARR